MNHFSKVILFAISLSLMVASVARAQLEVNAVDFLDGLELYQNGDFDQAARAWGELAQRLNDRFAEDDSLQRSGLASVLASMAWERAGDSRAYTEWARSIETLLIARSSWSEVRGRLDELVTQSRRELSAVDSETGAVKTDADLVAIIAVYEATDFSQFDGPAAGLTGSVDKEEDITISRSYFARPLSLVEQDEGVEQDALQRPSGLDDEQPASDDQQIGRGMNSEAIEAQAPVDQDLRANTAEGPGQVELDINVNTTDTARNVTPDGPPIEIESEQTGEGPSADGDGVVETADSEQVLINTSDGPGSDDEAITVMPVRDEVATAEDLLSDTVPDIEGSEVDSEATVMGVSIRPSGAPLDDDAAEQTSDDFVDSDNLPLDLPQISQPEPPEPTEPVRFGPIHQQMAVTAWQYFLTNYQDATGMINAVQEYPRSTLWDVGSGLAAIVSAAELGIIDRVELRERLDLYLRTLKDLPLYNDELPNREYSIDSGRMIGRGNKRDDIGTGWSALDIGRSLVWLRIAHNWYPEMRTRIDEVVESWTFDRLINRQQMNGTFLGRRGEKYYQEGRLGYEQYSATGLTLWGFDMARATNYDLTTPVDVNGESILQDTRTRPFFTSDPFVLATIELGGIDEKFSQLTEQFFLIQEQRWRDTGEIYVSAEDSLDKRPWFVYNNLTWFGEPWACLSFGRERVENCPNVSTKNALGWSVIYNTPFARALGESVEGLESDKNGFYAGRYSDGTINRSLNINTNAIVLEALLYLKRGRKAFVPLIQDDQQLNPPITTELLDNTDSF